MKIDYSKELEILQDIVNELNNNEIKEEKKLNYIAHLINNSKELKQIINDILGPNDIVEEFAILKKVKKRQELCEFLITCATILGKEIKYIEYDNSEMTYTNNTYKWYISMCQSNKILPDEEIKRIIVAIRNGEINKKLGQEKIYGSFSALVVDRVKKHTMYNLNIDIMELISAGNLGLLKAIKRFDLSKNVKFVSYATWWIDQAIIEQLKSNNIITIPPNQIRHYKNYVFESEKNPNKEIPCCIKKETREKLAAALNVVALDEPVCEDGFTLGEMICAPDDVEETGYNKMLSNEIRDILNMLPEQERLIIMYRFGFTSYGKSTLKETAQQLTKHGYEELSTQRINQIEKRALGKLKENKKIKRYQ